jgi:hydrogenase expression/formation protein HypC
MCIALPARVLAIEADHAVVDLDGRIRRASMVRMPDVAVGDWALVAAGTVLRRLEPEEAADLGRLLRGAMTEPTRAPLRGGFR